MCPLNYPGSYDGAQRTSQLQPNWTSLYQRPKSPSKASPTGLPEVLADKTITQGNILGASQCPLWGFLLIHSWTDFPFFMQFLLSAFPSRPRCSFTPNKTGALFLCVHAVAWVHFLIKSHSMPRIWTSDVLKTRSKHKTSSLLEGILLG